MLRYWKCWKYMRLAAEYFISFLASPSRKISEFWIYWDLAGFVIVSNSPPASISQQERERNLKRRGVISVCFYSFVVPKYCHQDFSVNLSLLYDGTPRLSKDKPRIDSCMENKLSNILLSKTFAFLLEIELSDEHLYWHLILVSVSMSNLFVTHPPLPLSEPNWVSRLSAI